MVAVFPFVRHAGISEDETDQFGESRLGANIIRQDEDAALAGLDADQSVGGLTVVTAFVEAVALGAVEDGDTEARVQVLTLAAHWQIWKEKRKQMGGRDMQRGLCRRHCGARGGSESIAADECGGELRQVGNCCIHRSSCADLAALLM